MKNMRNLFASFSIFYLIFLNSCGIDILEPLGENTYYVVRYSASGSKVDKASIEYVGKTDNLQVYVESGYSYSLYNIKQVTQKFENNYRQMINIYGAHTDMDKNGKIKLLFVDINGNNRSSSIVMGYFLPNDLIYGSANNGEILYMDINVLNSNPGEIAGTVLHEFQHLINFNVNYLKKGKEMSLWLDECLAESTAILFDSSVVQSRIKEFNQIDYYCFYTWNLPYPYQNYFVNYPSASVFMNWLYNRNSSDVFRRIASSSQTQDYDKVLKSASGLGSTWQALLTNWINGVKNGQVSGAKIGNRTYTTTLYPGALIYDGSQVRVNPSTELANPSSATMTVSRANAVSGRSAINNEEISLQSMEIKIENNTNDNQTKYIDLVFDRDGKVRKY